MQNHERDPAVEVVQAAFAAVWLPFRWIASLPRAGTTLVRWSAGRLRERGRSAERARFDSSKWTLALLRHLEWRRFEELCAAYFESLGFAARITRSPAGGAADIALHLEGAGAPTVLARCKAWSAYPIGIRTLQELRAAMAPAGVGEAVFVTSGKFTQEAVQFAAKERIELIDGARLLEEFAGLAPEKALALLKLATKGDFLTPTCPCCSIKMTSRKSTGEGRAFWGCLNYPRCKQTFSSTENVPA
jgi:restriction system protein